ncbi:hypothetical protein D0865_00638, partial [Hortaea werneckii]
QDSPQKGTYFISFPSLEGDIPRSYNDEVLKPPWGLHAPRQKLCYNALKAHSDFYGQYNRTALFYSDSNAIGY